MLLRSPWKGAALQAPYRINGASQLSRGLVFAWAGHLGLDLVGGGRPVNTNVAEATQASRSSWRFAGGGVGNSDLNFGAVAATADLHDHSSTFAFYATATASNLIGLAAQNDSNASNAGWQIYCDPSSNITAEFERLTTNVQSIVSAKFTANVPATVVVTFDGGNLRAGVNTYFNGVLAPYSGGHDGAGAGAPATAQNLYLGRRNFNTALSHSGDIMVALLANRAWSDAEARAFHEDPYRAFLAPRSVTYSFAGAVPVGASGTAGMVFNATGRLGAKVPVSGAAGMVFSAAGTATTGAVVTASSGGTAVIGRRKVSIFSPLISVNLPGGSTLLDRTQGAIKRAMDAIAQGQIGNLSERAGIWTITPGPAAPVGNPPKGSYYVYCDPTDRKWKSRGSSGTITILGTP